MFGQKLYFPKDSMINIGKFNKLKVIREEAHGFYLEGDETWDDILLPNKYAPDDLEIDDEIEVFVYFDSDDLIIATTLKPYATVGEFAALEVSAVDSVGVFLDWGLEKELFVPFREKLFEMLPGKKYVVYIYIDSSGRIAASTRIAKHASKITPPFKERQKVELLPFHDTDMGVNAIINGSHLGLIYNDEIYSKLTLGEKITGYIKKIRPDNRIDLRLQPDGLGGRVDLSEEIFLKLKESGGTLNINSKTSAETIYSMFNVSKKKYKIALGLLYKKELIIMTEDGIALRETSK